MSDRSLASRAIRRTPLRWWLPNQVTRIELIQRAVHRLSAVRYLEIGVSDGDCFTRVSVATKIGVDPIAPAPLVTSEIKKPGTSYYRLTSDQFFQLEAPRVLREKVDVVFVDGLHTFDQAYRDCVSAVTYLAPDGILLVHDCLPTSEAEARVAASYEEVRALSGPDWNLDWTGDTWKAIVKLRASHSDLETRVLNCDHGVAVVYRGPNQSNLSLNPEQIGSMTYADLARDKKRLLGVCPPRHLFGVLERLAGRRESRAGHG